MSCEVGAFARSAAGHFAHAVVELGGGAKWQQPEPTAGLGQTQMGSIWQPLENTADC